MRAIRASPSSAPFVPTEACGRPPPTDPGLILGDVAIDGIRKKAYVFAKGNPQGTWVSDGETFLGWTVQSIDSGAAKLKQSNRVLDLQLYPMR